MNGWRMLASSQLGIRHLFINISFLEGEDSENTTGDPKSHLLKHNQRCEKKRIDPRVGSKDAMQEHERTGMFFFINFARRVG